MNRHIDLGAAEQALLDLVNLHIEGTNARRASDLLVRVVGNWEGASKPKLKSLETRIGVRFVLGGSDLTEDSLRLFQTRLRSILLFSAPVTRSGLNEEGVVRILAGEGRRVPKVVRDKLDSFLERCPVSFSHAEGRHVPSILQRGNEKGAEVDLGCHNFSNLGQLPVQARQRNTILPGM